MSNQTGLNTGNTWMGAGVFQDFDRVPPIQESGGTPEEQEIKDLPSRDIAVIYPNKGRTNPLPEIEYSDNEESSEQAMELPKASEEPQGSYEPFVLSSPKWNLSKGQVGLISVATVIVVIVAIIVGLYFGNTNAHDFLVRKITIANTLLYAGVPVVGLALIFRIGLYVYKKHQKRLSDVVTEAMTNNRTIGDSPAYIEPRSIESRENQRRDLEAALEKQRLTQWGITLKGLLPTPKQLGITAIVLLVLAGLAVGGYFLCTHVPAVQHWVNNDLIPAFNHQIQAWEAIAYSGAVVVGLPLVGIAIKKLVPPALRKVKAAFEKWEDARNRCPYTDPNISVDFSED